MSPRLYRTMQVRIDYLQIVSQLPLYGAALLAFELQKKWYLAHQAR